jgi:PAS domain S-box-containing protein
MTRKFQHFFAGLSIKRKIFYSTVSMFLLVVALNSLAYWFILVPMVAQQIRDRSLQVAHVLIDQCRPHLLANNYLEVSRILFEKKNLDNSIAFLFVEDKEKKIFAHTFEKGVPPAVKTLEAMPDSHVIRVDRTWVYHTVVPIDDDGTTIGYVHIGMEKKPIDAVVLEMGITLLGVVLVIILLAIVLSNLGANYISRPLVQLTQDMLDLCAGKRRTPPYLTQKARCWEIQNCDRVECPVHDDDERICWFTDNTLGHDGPQTAFPEKMEHCRQCEVYKSSGGDEIVQITNAFNNIIYSLQHQAQECVKTEEKRRLLFNFDPNPILVTKIDLHTILEVNDPAVEMFGYDPQELFNMSFLSLFHSDDAERLREELKNYRIGQYFYVPKLWVRTKGGHPFYINIHARVVNFTEPINGYTGHSLIMRTIDITQRLEQETQLTQASKMATLGEMATGIAHELNQPLNVIKVGADFFNKMISRDREISNEQLRQVSTNISEQVDRATSIINHLREFGRKSDFGLYLVDLNEPIRGVFTLLGQQLKVRSIEVELNLEENLPKILADKNRLEQIFLNLVTNARDAMEEREAGAARRLAITTRRENGRVTALVSDTGMGIPERLREKIFEPFFTTKGAGEGTGLGLSITYSLVKDFKGNIEVDSIPGEGTTFRVSFPIQQEEDRKNG